MGLFNWKAIWPFNRNKEPEEKGGDLLPFSTSDGLPDLELQELKKNYVLDNAIQKKAPVPSSIQSSAMDSSSTQYQQQYEAVNWHLLSYYIASSGFIGYQAMALISQHWLIIKGSSIKVKDAVKKWYEISVNDDTELTTKQIKRIEKLDKKFKLKRNMIQAVTFNNVFGIRHVLFKMKDPNFDYEKPFNPDSIKKGDYLGISQIDPNWIVPVLDDLDLTDPSSIGYFEPTFWEINGRRYHRSHFVILVGEPVADYLKPTYRYGGISLAQRAYERVYAAERTANEAPQLTMTKRLNVRKTNLTKAQANKEQFIKNVQTANDYRDNYGQVIIDKDEDMTMLETTLSDLDNVIKGQYEIVCAIYDVPSSKLLGDGHSGFSTGETDSDYYLESVEAIQGDELEAIAEQHYIRLVRSELMHEFNVPEFEVEVNWRPMKVESAKEVADRNHLKAQTDNILADNGAIDSEDIRNRVTQEKDSGYTGIESVDFSQGDYDGEKEDQETKE
ncbi:hypothetical protein EDB29_1011116 [Vibrio crassostreae]|uniref:phage portal protein n=1 Tax=Vibrio crassostreae TaxID=246167 RepID=UPI001052ECE5|nr:DUF1073 domain-containing protein [Vibrio crassostreae]CAH6850954.1 conserved hypothetical protein [Vibrio chagasii]TCT44304.1 hypothetical protein EDB29_1011116 [Vibrio crassostreae]CAH6862472.1 conserved hypothetical protein [Vibrio chagasii]CAH6927070.1 conserved hypothetical protein [Vibrio chagasii]CAH6946444.1 conserved hypothetical protein [Vibrio chagasii]